MEMRKKDKKNEKKNLERKEWIHKNRKKTKENNWKKKTRK